MIFCNWIDIGSTPITHSYIVLWFMSRFWDWTIPRIHRDLTVMQPSYLVWWSADILGWPGRCSYCQSFASSQVPSHIESRNRGRVNILPQRSNTWPMIFHSCGLQIQFSMILFLVLMVDHCMRDPHCQSNHPQPEEGVVFSIIPFLRATIGNGWEWYNWLWIPY